MYYETLVYQKAGAVGTITINRPAVNNSVNMQLAEELTEICADVNGDEEIKVIIITGAGDKAFSVGVDLNELSSAAGSGQETRLLSVAMPVASITSPVIAAINGDALGQGLELALACDLRIAVDTARFALTHVASGLIPWDGATQRLPRLVGRGKAMEMLLTAQYIDAREAYQIGLASKVTRREEVIPMATDMAQAMASKASLPLKYAKEAIHNGLDLTLEQGLRLEADLYFLLQTTEDRTEGIRAFLEKRPPQFKGK
jgi:enoyl-CoA hydratase